MNNLTPDPSPKERGEETDPDVFSKRMGEEQISVSSSKEIKEESVPGYITTDSITYKKIKPFTLENRKNQTKAEAILWEALRNRKLGFKFRRQHAIENYIVDFVCLSERLIIEVDGDIHNDPDQMQYDKTRTDCIISIGYSELRFKNEEVINNLNKVTKSIIDFINKKNS